jgi:hypothetical protein
VRCGAAGGVRRRKSGSGQLVNIRSEARPGIISLANAPPPHSALRDVRLREDTKAWSERLVQVPLEHRGRAGGPFGLTCRCRRHNGRCRSAEPLRRPRAAANAPTQRPEPLASPAPVMLASKSCANSTPSPQVTSLREMYLNIAFWCAHEPPTASCRFCLPRSEGLYRSRPPRCILTGAGGKSRACCCATAPLCFHLKRCTASQGPVA